MKAAMEQIRFKGRSRNGQSKTEIKVRLTCKTLYFDVFRHLVFFITQHIDKTNVHDKNDLLLYRHKNTGTCDIAFQYPVWRLNLFLLQAKFVV